MDAPDVCRPWIFRNDWPTFNFSDYLLNFSHKGMTLCMLFWLFLNTTLQNLCLKEVIWLTQGHKELGLQLSSLWSYSSNSHRIPTGKNDTLLPTCLCSDHCIHHTYISYIEEYRVSANNVMDQKRELGWKQKWGNAKGGDMM